MQDGAQAWDDHASTYASLFAPLTGFIARSMFTMTETRLPANARILDIACGSGALTFPAIERAMRERAAGGMGGHVVAADFSPGMVAITAEAARARGVPADLYTCEVQNGEALTFPDAQFDGVYSCFGIFLFGDRLAGWREAARVLKPGGVFATAVWQGPETNAMLRTQMMPIVAALPEALRPKQKPAWMEIAEAGALASEIDRTGMFTDVKVRPFTASFAMCPWPLGWDALRNNPVMGALLARCSPEDLERVRSAFFAALREQAGGDDEPLIVESACNILLARRK